LFGGAIAPQVDLLYCCETLSNCGRINSMDCDSANFSEPPVVEVALSVQFEPLGMTSGHMGWYWRECLGDSWPNVEEVPPVPDQIETFGEKRVISWPRMGFQFKAGPTTNRLRISNSNKDRMIQIQDTRFIYNWVKKNGVYPRYKVIREEFDKHFTQFLEFTTKAELATLKQNQWEVTYVNHIPSGTLWCDSTEGEKVFPALLKRPISYGGTTFESMLGEWRSEIPQKRGRLHISIRYQEVKRSDVLVAQLTTRGPLTDEQDLNRGLNLGHVTIVKAFVDISSEAARKYWKEV
jgi:uncharacterized protein (TIGR04255 family)